MVSRDGHFVAFYEYTDIRRTHWNGLIAGLRFWF
jgi:hypothetical protein